MILCASHRLQLVTAFQGAQAPCDRAAALISCAAIEHDHEAWQAPATTCPVCYYGEESWIPKAISAVQSGIDSESLS